MSEDRTLLKSAYEVAREAKIRANYEELVSIGLAHHHDDKLPKRKFKRKTTEMPTRFSKRLRNIEPDKTQTNSEDVKKLKTRDLEHWKVASCKIQRLKELHEAEGTTYRNPSATYEHTWMRVKTMSDKALEKRISVIEKARGQNCIVKMRMFAEVLVLVGKEELARNCQAALDRLLNILKDSTKDMQ